MDNVGGWGKGRVPTRPKKIPTPGGHRVGEMGSLCTHHAAAITVPVYTPHITRKQCHAAYISHPSSHRNELRSRHVTWCTSPVVYSVQTARGRRPTTSSTAPALYYYPLALPNPTATLPFLPPRNE
jgi:hypothetical protein